MRLTYSVAEAAAVLGVSQSTIYGQVREGRLPHVRLGGRILLPKAAIRRFLEGGSKNVEEGIEKRAIRQ